MNAPLNAWIAKDSQDDARLGVRELQSGAKAMEIPGGGLANAQRIFHRRGGLDLAASEVGRSATCIFKPTPRSFNHTHHE